jgi:hypothetical protein
MAFLFAVRSPRGLAPTLLSIGSMIPTTATKVHFCSYTLPMGGGMAGKIDWFQFWVRFACGALFGLLMAIRPVLYWYHENLVVLVPVALGVVLLCGLSAARYGDKFWY